MLAPLKALLALVVIAILSIVLLAIVRPMSLKWSNRNKVAYADAVLASSNILAGAREFKFASDQEYMVEKFNGRYADRTDATARMHIWGNMAPRMMIAIGQVGLLAVVLVLWLTGVTSAQLVSQMAVLLLVTSRIIPAISQMFGIMNKLWQGLPWIERLHEMRLSIRRDRSSERHHERVGTPPFNWQKISVRNLSFGYDENRGKVLDGISFDLEYGLQYGLVGASGSGKSSLVDLLSGLLQPDSGTITVDDVDLNTLAGDVWRRQVGYVSQTPYFVDDSLRSNVAYGIAPDDIDDQLVWQCLSMALIDQVVRDLPDGLDTKLGESSVQLSGGQRQRLAIARALYKRPRLLILDEATSALDMASEERVLTAIDSLRGKLTVLSISHRTSAVANCDKTFELTAGHLRECNPNDTMVTEAQASG
jgi:ABC-type multidrug transport system fused ATPase/permease subunit